MIGVVIVTHYRLAEEFLQALRLIVSEVDHVRALGLDPTIMSPEERRAQIDKTLREGDHGSGVLGFVRRHIWGVSIVFGLVLITGLRPFLISRPPAPPVLFEVPGQSRGNMPGQGLIELPAVGKALPFTHTSCAHPPPSTQWRPPVPWFRHCRTVCPCWFVPSHR